ncbi:MAG: NAD-dependent epimerase/dehydratase family protein [Actinobacteria bacterium]|nr:NAD-dependent epimerase/dehydratase family protein [Actinomycetota bacterium]MCG2803227.1 NAD-dependent epimerase/dehydratase family protein [Cellulomonas sp.]
MSRVPGPRVGVLGGQGFIGSAAARLLARDRDVLVIDRSEGRNVFESSNVETRAADVTDPDALAEALDDCTSVVFAVGAMLPAESTASPISDVQHTLTPVLRVLDYLRDRPGMRLVFLSSGGTVYGNPAVVPVLETHPTEPISSYGILKLTAEHYMRMYRVLYGVDGRVLRVANAYGPGQPSGRSQGVVANFVHAAMRDEPLTVFGSGRAVRDYIHVNDVASAIRAALDTDGPHVVNVATGVGTSTHQIISMLEHLMGKTLKVDQRPARTFDVDAIVLDASALVAMTGTEPIPLERGLREVYQAAVASATTGHQIR